MILPETSYTGRVYRFYTKKYRLKANSGIIGAGFAGQLRVVMLDRVRTNVFVRKKNARAPIVFFDSVQYTAKRSIV